MSSPSETPRLPESRAQPAVAWLRSLRLPDALAFMVIIASSWLLTGLGTPGGKVFFNLGPNDHSYLNGFVDYYEVAEGTATRWTSYDSTIELPLTVAGGPTTIAFRFARIFPETASVQVLLDGRLIDVFDCRGGEIRDKEIEVAALPKTPVTIRFVADSHERQNRGIRLDWLRVTSGERGTLSVQASPRLRAALFLGVLFALFRFVGLKRFLSTAMTIPWIVAGAAWARFDPFGFAHFSLHVLGAAFFLTAATAWFLRRFSGGRWVLPIFVAGLLLKSAGLFHPTTFYPDVANARRYVMAYPEANANTLAERGVETQKKMGVGYPRSVGGKDYAFPYSPLYFLSFTWIDTSGKVEDAVRLTGLAATALMIPLLFWMGSAIMGPRLGILAAALMVMIPPATSRMVLAHHATLLGNFLDGLMIAATLAFFYHPDSRKRWLAVSGFSLMSLLAYVSSLFSVGSFLTMAAVANRQLTWRLLATLGMGSLITVSWLYWPFTILFVTEIIPAVLAGADTASSASTDALTKAQSVGLVHALNRLLIFYGAGYGILAAVGLFLARKTVNPRAFRWIVSWALAFLALVTLRAFGGGMFRDLKEITFAAPLVALLAAVSLHALSRRGRSGTVAATLIVVGLFVFGLQKYRGYLESYYSPLMVVVVDD